MTKSWILALAAIPLVVWLFLRVPRNIMPTMVTNGTEQILAQWRDALLDFKKDNGKFPERNEERNFGESIMGSLTEDNPLKKIYLDISSVRISQTVPVDGWDTPLTFDPDGNGDMAHIISNGPDGVYQTADDIDSLKVPQRHLPVPPDPSDDKAKSKAKATPTP